MVEARSVNNVKGKHTQDTQQHPFVASDQRFSFVIPDKY